MTARDLPAEVRRAAAALAEAIREARAAGYWIDMEFRAEALGRIAVSETGKVVRRDAPPAAGAAVTAEPPPNAPRRRSGSESPALGNRPRS